MHVCCYYVHVPRKFLFGLCIWQYSLYFLIGEKYKPIRMNSFSACSVSLVYPSPGGPGGLCTGYRRHSTPSLQMKKAINRKSADLARWPGSRARWMAVWCQAQHSNLSTEAGQQAHMVFVPAMRPCPAREPGQKSLFLTKKLTLGG